MRRTRGLFRRRKPLRLRAENPHCMPAALGHRSPQSGYASVMATAPSIWPVCRRLKPSRAAGLRRNRPGRPRHVCCLPLLRRRGQQRQRHHMARMLRQHFPTMPGRPAVIIATQFPPNTPMKSQPPAPRRWLVPQRGRWQFEALWADDEQSVTTLHWQGKLRGRSFASIHFC